jgi:hypothetical protein
VKFLSNTRALLRRLEIRSRDLVLNPITTYCHPQMAIQCSWKGSKSENLNASAKANGIVPLNFESYGIASAQSEIQVN